MSTEDKGISEYTKGLRQRHSSGFIFIVYLNFLHNFSFRHNTNDEIFFTEATLFSRRKSSPLLLLDT